MGEGEMSNETIVLATRTNAGDILTMLLKAQQLMDVTDQGPDVGPFLNCEDPEKNWYDPRRPLATDVWRALAGLSLKYHSVQKETDMKRFMVMRKADKYTGEFFETREEAEKHAMEECNGDPGGDFLVLEVIGSVTRPRHPEAVLTRMP